MNDPGAFAADADGPRYMEVGISALYGNGGDSSCEQAASDLVRRALQDLEIDTTPVRLAVLLATADWCESHATLPREFRDRLKEELGYEVPLIGGSMAKLYYSVLPSRSSITG